MENTNLIDIIFGTLAMLILISGLIMLFQGMSAFDQKK